MKIGVCLPSKGRANQLEAWLGEMLLQPLPAAVKQLQTVVAVEASDQETQNAVIRLSRLWRESDAPVFMKLRENNSTAVMGWNLAFEALPGCDWYVLGADDIRWHEGWLQEALNVAHKTGALVIGLNDGHTNIDDYAPHYMVHIDFINRYLDGHFIPPAYMTWWFDREICQKARVAGLYAASWSSWCEHRHPDWKTANEDDTYREAKPLRNLDKTTYLTRMKQAGIKREMVKV